MSLKEPPAWPKLFLDKVWVCVCVYGMKRLNLTNVHNKRTKPIFCTNVKHKPVPAWIMAGNSRNNSGFNFSCPIQSFESFIFCHLKSCVVSFHSMSAQSPEGAAFCFLSRVLSLFFSVASTFMSIKQTSLQILELWLQATCSLVWTDVMSERLLCEALHPGWPVEISVTLLITVLFFCSCQYGTSVFWWVGYRLTH